MVCCIRFRNRSASPCPGPWVWLFGGTITLLLPNSWPYLSSWLTAFVWGPAQTTRTPLLLTWCPVPRVSYFLSHTQAHLSTFYPDQDWESTFWLWLYFLKMAFLGQGRQIWFFQPYDQPECLKAYLACFGGGKGGGGGRDKMKWRRLHPVAWRATEGSDQGESGESHV